MLRFELLESYEARIGVFPLYHQLNPYPSEEKFRQRMQEMMQEAGYKLLGVFEGDKLLAISGYWIAHKLYCGKYLEADNVVVDENARSLGIGQQLQQELERIARENQCNVMMLDAYLENTAGHRFYERAGYEKKGYHFIKKLR